MEVEQSSGYLIVLTGPTGIGKDTIMQKLLKDPSLQAKRLVTYATRVPRPEETDGVDYHFVTEKQFFELDSKGKLAEKVHYGSTWKGTPYTPFNQILTGSNLVWTIDPSRAALIEEFYNQGFDPEKALRLLQKTLVIYLGLSDIKLLRDRYKTRAGDNYDPSEFRRRSKQDIKIWKKHRDSFPYVVLNDQPIEQTFQEVRDLITQKFGI